jgi:hypothetical protein
MKTHAAIGLPTYPEDVVFASVDSQLGGLQGVENMRCGIAPKIADTGCPVIDSLGNLGCALPACSQRFFAIMPVLTEKTVERARLEKHRQVFETLLRSLAVGIFRESTTCSAGTDPVCNTVGGKGIKIAGKVTLSGPAADKFSPLIESGAAVTPASIWNSTPIGTQITWRAFLIMGRDRGESEILFYARMDTIQTRFDFIEAGKNTFRAQIEGRAYQTGNLVAVKTLRHMLDNII